MNAAELINRLISVEMDSATEPDMRRVIRDERMAVQAATQARPVNSEDIGRSMREAIRVARMWGVEGLPYIASWEA